MTEQSYEHRIPRKYPNLIQVRPKRLQGQRRGDWRTYWIAATDEEAERILRMLNEPVTEGVVTP